MATRPMILLFLLIHYCHSSSAATGSNKSRMIAPPTYLSYYWLVFLFILNFVALDVVATEDEFLDCTDGVVVAQVILATLLAVVPEIFDSSPPPQKRRKTTFRERRFVQSIMQELGESYIPRAYRMKEQSFWILLDKISPYLTNKSAPRPGSKKRHRNGARNGIIEAATKLSMALRYFAGGCPPDIAVMHGVSPRRVLPCVWEVVDAVNFCESMKIEFPKDHSEQKKIARGFQKRSKADFDICVGCIDGMLIWIHKPSDEDCYPIGAKKFYSGHKKKFGLNMQGVCDAKKRFLDVEINSPGATSDYLSFMRSNLRFKLETDGFLSPGLALFGDNAYVNSWYMAVPFKGDGAKDVQNDAYNYYHSNTRINIECAFGMLVHRWAILRKPIPCNITIGKTTALVTCLCRLHNYCIDQKEGRAQASTNIDEFELMSRGAVPFDRHGIPRQLLGAGDHHDGTDRNYQRQMKRQMRRQKRKTGNQNKRNSPTSKTTLPFEYLFDMVVEKGLERPALRAL